MSYRLYETETATGHRVWESSTVYDSYDEVYRLGERKAVGRYTTEFATECTTCHALAESPHYHTEPALSEESTDA